MFTHRLLGFLKETVSEDRINPFIHETFLEVPLILFLFGEFSLITLVFCNSFSKALHMLQIELGHVHINKR